MTMQTTSLPFQVSGANLPGQAQRAQASTPDKDAGAFGATLSREIAQRQQAAAPAPAPAPAGAAPAPASAARPSTPASRPAGDKPQAPAKAPAADRQGAQPAKSAAQDNARTDGATSTAATGAAAGAAQATAAAAAADTDASTDALHEALAAAGAATPAAAVAADPASADAAAAVAAADSAIAAAEAATTPVTDMLAFMASLTQPAALPPIAAPLAAPAAAPAFAPAPAAAVATAAPTLQANPLESAFAKLGTADGATAAADPALLAVAPQGNTGTQGEAAAAGFQLPAGVQPTMLDTAEQRVPQQAAQPAVQPDAGKLAPQARDGAAPALAASDTLAPAPALSQLQAQVSKLEAAANPAMVPGDRIPARVGSQAWDNQVSQRIVYMVGKEQAATLTLNPPDLGPVQVVLNVSNEGASVTFSSNQLEVRQALENAIPRLREMMGESGIALGNATVDAGMPDQRQAQQDGERRHGGGGGAFNNGNGNAAANDEAAARPATRTVALGDSGMVDTFA